MGVDFRTRGRRADEAIDVLRLLWAGGEDGVSFQGEFFSFDGVCSFPKPHGATDLPIHVGGSSRAAARRAGRRGDGYFPGGMLTPQERGVQWELARSAAVEGGRDPNALEYTRWGSIDMPIERVEAFAAQGVTRIVVGATAIEPAHNGTSCPPSPSGSAFDQPRNELPRARDAPDSIGTVPLLPMDRPASDDFGELFADAQFAESHRPERYGMAWCQAACRPPLPASGSCAVIVTER